MRSRTPLPAPSCPAAQEPAMLSVFDTRPGYSRREFLRIGTLGLGGLSLPHLLGARAGASKPITTGKSVVFLYLFGGPPQHETFDPKMTAPDGIRTVTGEVTTALFSVCILAALAL